MVKIKLILITIIICGVFLLAGCGDNGNGSSQPSGVSNSSQNIQGAENKKKRLMPRNFWNML